MIARLRWGNGASVIDLAYGWGTAGEGARPRSGRQEGTTADLTQRRPETSRHRPRQRPLLTEVPPRNVEIGRRPEDVEEGLRGAPSRRPGGAHPDAGRAQVREIPGDPRHRRGRGLGEGRRR